MNFDVILIGLGIFGLPFVFILVCFVIAFRTTNRSWKTYLTNCEAVEETEVYTYTEWNKPKQEEDENEQEIS